MKEMFISFNTDDGIRRAAIMGSKLTGLGMNAVSIPMTVLGGLQLAKKNIENTAVVMFQYR